MTVEFVDLLAKRFVSYGFSVSLTDHIDARNDKLGRQSAVSNR